MSSLSLKALLKDKADSQYNDPSFLTFVNDHVPYLLASVSTKTIAVDPSQALKYKGDLYGLLAELQIPYFMHYAVMKMNGFSSPTQAREEIISQIKAPEVAEFRKLHNLWRAHNATRK